MRTYTQVNTYLSVEEVHEQLLHLGDARAAAHQHNLVDLTLVDLRVAQHLLHRLQRRAEQVVAKLLEASTRDRAKRGGKKTCKYIIILK